MGATANAVILQCSPTKDNNMKMQKETFQKAVDWLNGRERDFTEGIEILKEATFKPAVTRKLERDGEQGPAVSERLEFQLREFVKAFGTPKEVTDTDAELHVFNGQEAPADQDEQQQLGIMAMAEKMEKGELQTNAKVAPKIVYSYAVAYRNREKAMRLMRETGEQNDETSMARRKQLSDEIEECTALMERLYPLYERYQSGADISEEDVAKALEKSSPANSTTTSENSAATDSSAAHTPDAVCPSVSPTDPASLEGKSRDELLKLKKNALVRLLRTENKLLYQSEKKQEVENPMPEGPERVKLETRAASIRKNIEAIDIAIAKFG